MRLFMYLLFVCLHKSFTRSKACVDFVSSYEQIWRTKMSINARFIQIYI